MDNFTRAQLELFICRRYRNNKPQNVHGPEVIYRTFWLQESLEEISGALGLRPGTVEQILDSSITGLAAYNRPCRQELVAAAFPCGGRLHAHLFHDRGLCRAPAYEIRPHPAQLKLPGF